MANAPLHQRTGVRIAVAVLIGLTATSTWIAIGPELVPLFDRWIEALGPFAEIGFVLIGGVLLACCAPASLLYITAGTVFGLWRGVLLGSAAAVIGALLAFAISRSALGERAARAIAKSSKLDRFEQALTKRGVWLVVLLRLSPIFPIGPVSYALGVMRIPLRDYLLAMPAVVPAVVVYAYAGHVARSLFGDHAKAREPWEWGVLVIGLLATALVTVWIGHAASHALKSGAKRPQHA